MHPKQNFPDDVQARAYEYIYFIFICYSHSMKGYDNDSMGLYGSVTVGERGQVVIPAEARDKLGIKPGDKLLAFQAPIGKSIILTTAEEFEGHMRRVSERLSKLQKQVKK